MAQAAIVVEYTDCTSSECQYSLNGCPEYDTKQSDSEASIMLELWGMQTAPLLPSLQVHSALL